MTPREKFNAKIDKIEKAYEKRVNDTHVRRLTALAQAHYEYERDVAKLNELPESVSGLKCQAG